MKAYEVRLTEHASVDLQEIVSFARHRDGDLRALAVLDRFEQVLDQLERLPGRGMVPRELAELGVMAFRQVHLKPWRVMYRVDGRVVTIILIVDGRRDLRDVLARRLLTS